MSFLPFHILKAVGKIVLPALGKIGKGKATVSGLVGVAATSAVLGLPFDLNEALVQVLEIIRQIATILTLLGFGRKTGAAVPNA